MAKVQRTTQHTVGVDDDLWNDCLALAKVERTTLSQVIRNSLVTYRRERLALLAEIKGVDGSAGSSSKES